MKKTIIIVTTLLVFFTGIQTIESQNIVTVEKYNLQTVDEAKDYLLENYPELYTVAQCESSWRQHVKNSQSSASGIFQFLDSTASWVYKSIYKEELSMEDKNNLSIQVEMAVWLYERYDLKHWQYPCGTLQ